MVEECSLLGPVGFGVQIMLGVLSFIILICKEEFRLYRQADSRKTKAPVESVGPGHIEAGMLLAGEPLSERGAGRLIGARVFRLVWVVSLYTAARHHLWGDPMLHIPKNNRNDF